MDPDHGTIFNFGRGSDLSAPPASDPLTDVISLLVEKTIARLQFVLFVAISVFSKVGFFYASLRLTQHCPHLNVGPVEAKFHIFYAYFKIVMKFC